MKIDGIAAVTGAGQGIGLQVAAALSRRGFDVLALVLDESQAEAVQRETAGGATRVTTQVLDVTDVGDFEFPENLQVLVNNAGMLAKYLPVEEMPMETWRRMFDVNFFGLIEVTRRAIPVLRTAGRGVICNVSSGAVFRPAPFSTTYRTSKVAVSALCDHLRLELAPLGIRVVEILPGLTATDMIKVTSMTRELPLAAEYPPYRPMAELQFEMSSGLGLEPTPVEAAGEAIADAIFDEGGPMRYGTDETSNRLLEQWRTTPNDVLADEVFASYARVFPT